MKSTITQDLIERMKEGDIEAFDEVYRLTIDSVYRTVYMMMPYKQDVDDIVSEIYVQLWRSVHNYRSESPFQHWLNGLVFRQVKNWKLKAWKRFNLLNKKKLLETEHYELTENSILRDEQNQQLVQVIHQMSYKLREIVVLYYFHDYSLKELAQVLDIPLGTVKSRHHLALKNLRANYQSTDFLRKVEVGNEC
ncbi:sigma-70 family RNA polymerase sigma factor [Pseudoneobacillus sp. C159]